MALETLDSRISRVIFHKPSRFNSAGEKFLIARTASGVTVKGSMERPVEGESYRFYGEYKTDRDRNEEAFAFCSYEVMIDQSTDGITQYLSRYVDGLGMVRAAAVVEHFGIDTLAILQTDPGRIAEVGGVSEKSAEALRRLIADPNRIDPGAYAKLVELFIGHHVRQSVIVALAKAHKSSAVDVIKSRPYSILLDYPGMGWKTVDAVAMTSLGYAADGIDRHTAAIVEALERIANDGHTYANVVDVEMVAFKELIFARPSDDAWRSLEADSLIVTRKGPAGREAALTKYAEAERRIAAAIARLTAGAKPLDASIDVSTSLNEDQRYAVEMIENEGVCLLVGAPGTGKSFTVARVIGGLIESGIGSIQVVAPTGKAAKRAAELIESALPTGRGGMIPCTTIHKALAPSPSDEDTGTPAATAKFGRGREEFGFAKNEANPLDCDWLFIDESSMVDVCLAASLFAAIPTGTRVVIIGDPNQLPSVGAGSFLRDLIAAGLPCITLDKIVRSDGGGRVVRACHAIKDGRRPEPAAKVSLPTENWVHIEVETPAEIAEQIAELHRPTKTFPDPMWDFQVVSPQRSTAMGCDNLNAVLGAKLNPSESSAGSDEDDRGKFRVGDKVVRTKNGRAQLLTSTRPTDSRSIPAEPKKSFDWRGERYTVGETTVVNGDMGTVLDIANDGKNTWVIVQFKIPDRLVRLPVGDAYILAAYAMTVHRCQGSGFPLVIVPVHHGFYYDSKTGRGLWVRELAYTAISRAEQLLITVGQFSAIEAAIGRKTVGRRNTRLVERLREAMPELAAEVPFA